MQPHTEHTNVRCPTATPPDAANEKDSTAVRWPLITLAIALATPFALGLIFFLFSMNKGWSDGIASIALGTGIGLGVAVIAGTATIFGFLKHYLPNNRSSRYLLLAFSVPPLLVIVLYFSMFAYAYGVHPINAEEVQPYIHFSGWAAFLLLIVQSWRCRKRKRN